MARKSRIERIEEIKQAVLEGAKTPEEISERIGITPGVVVQYAVKSRIDVPFPKTITGYISSRRNPERDNLIEQGLTLAQIGGRTGVTRERVSQYIVQTGQHKKWQEARRIERGNKIQVKYERENVLEQIVSQIGEVARRQVPKKDLWAYEKALEYTERVQLRKYNFWDIFNLLKDYKDTKDKGEKKSLEEFEKSAGFSFTQVGKVLERLGLEPCYGKRVRVLFKDEERKMFEDAYKSGLSALDIDYFLGGRRAESYISGNKPKRKALIKCPQAFSYRIASQVYEALDLGFNKDETRELLGVPRGNLGFIIKHKEEISETIVNGLKILYPEGKIDKPYL